MKNSFKDIVESCKGNKKAAFRFAVNNSEITYDRFYSDCISKQSIISELPSHNIAICMDNTYDWIVTFFGTQLSGKTAILLDPVLSSGRIKEICQRYSASCLTAASCVLTNSTELPQLQNGKMPHISTVVFTSGTEGESKGVALSEEGILSSVLCSVNRLKLSKTDVIIHVLPFFHAFGLAAEVIATVVSKATLCFGNWLGTLSKDINTFNASVMFAVPSIAKGIFSAQNTISSLEKIIIGSAAVDEEIISYIPSNISIYFSYGLSECSPVVALSTKNDTYKEHYSGRLLPCCKAIVSDDGEICISGSNVMLGYYDGQALDRSMIIDEYYHTGDLGYIMEDMLYVTGRKRNLLCFSNGEKIGIESLEQKITEHLELEDCYIWQNDSSSINIILLTSTSHHDYSFGLSECLPLGVEINQVHLRSKPFLYNTLGKKIRNICLQLQ